MTATPNSVVHVPIVLNDANNIGSMNFVLTYNSQVLKVNKIDTGALLSGALFMTNYKAPPLVRASTVGIERFTRCSSASRSA